MSRPSEDADLFGTEDDWDEDNSELGIDYELSNKLLEETIGQGRAPIMTEVVSNPAPVVKVLEKDILDVKFDRPNKIALITFTDGSQLVIRRAR